MSFYTSLTGLNGAQADISAISNNIANVGTTGFKRSRAEFGDIFATSPLQAASSAIGSGTILKSIKQQFTQGNIEASLNALDLAISGQGFFVMKPSLTSTQTVYTRNGAFSVNNDRYVVDSQGQLLQVFPVNDDGSVIATGIQSARNLQLPTTSGLPKASETIQLGLNLPADAEIIPNKSIYNESNPYRFDKTNAATYNKSTSITIYDSLGNPTIATIYYVKTSNATETSPTNKWQTHVFVGDREVTPQLITAKDDQSKTFYINKFGQITTDPQSVDPTFNAAAAHPLYKQDDQTNKAPSTAAKVVGGIIKTSGFDFGDTDANKVTIITDPTQYNLTREGGQTGSNPPYWGRDMFTISVDGSEPQSVSIKAGTYTGTQLAEELTRAVNAKFSGEKYFRVTDTYRKEGGAVVPGNDIIQINLSRLNEDGSSIAMENPIEIDLLGAGGSDGTPPVDDTVQAENKRQLTRDELVSLAQTKLNDALNKRRLEYGKPANWPDPSDPPIRVGYDVGARALTFTVVPNQLGPDANEPASRFNSIQVFNPTGVTNDLGLPPKTSSPDTLIRANTLWKGTATLPSGDPILDPREQRTGITVSYNKDTRQFVFSSGSTGEASTITVGRSTLANSSDVKAQVDSFDVSTIDFTEDHKVTLEIDGREFTYDYPGAFGTSAKFFAGIEQAFPVSFGVTKEVQQGTSSTNEKQSFEVFGKIMMNDQFELTLPGIGSAGPTTKTVTITPAVAPTTEDVSIAFTNFTAGLNPTTMTIADVTVTLSADATADEIADMFASYTFADYDVVSTSGSPLVLRAKVAGAISDITPVIGGEDGKEVATIDFTDFVAGGTPSTIEIDGQTITLSADKTGAEIAALFAAQTFPNYDVVSAVGGQLTLRSKVQGDVLDVTALIAGGDGTETLAPPTIGTTVDTTVVVSAPVATITQGVNGSSGASFTDETTTEARLTALTSAISAQLSGTGVTVNRNGNRLEFAYASNGNVASTISMVQTVRGSDDASLAAINFTSRTVQTSSTSFTNGSANNFAEFTATIKTVSNSSPSIAAGDVYRITLPQADGSILVKDVTVGGAGGLAGLVSAADAAFSNITVSLVPANEKTDTIRFKYDNTGSITGDIKIEQIRVNSKTVRPDAVGPISVGHYGTSNLQIEGDPSGKPFRLNLRVDGVVKPQLPVGAQGSTSVNGLQIGEAKGINYLGSNDLLGVGPTASVQLVEGTGLAATAATAVGARAITPMSQTFFLNESLRENEMTFTVDGIVGTITLPVRAYTGDTFAAAIQDRVNQIQDPKTGRIVSGVKVRFEPDENRLVFTSGTTGTNSQINVVGHPNFGLGKVTQTPGSVPIITNLQQATDEQGNKLYVDIDGNITTQAPGSLQNWYPLYLTEGQLTFDTIGKLISPKEGVIYSPFDPQNGSDLLRLNIDYGKYSTQFSSPFSVLSLSQDGYPSGSLNGLDIDAGGTVRANYTNGQTVALGKVMIANFANPNGLKQIGNANYVATSTSGQVVLGQAGADGFGTIKAGALERSNVDITEELVNLITAQRNFQANAKAIETTTTLSQTIIQIRG